MQVISIAIFLGMMISIVFTIGNVAADGQKEVTIGTSTVEYNALCDMDAASEGTFKWDCSTSVGPSVYCKWEGLTCADDNVGPVIKIWKSDSDINKGTISSSIGLLTNLKSIIFSSIGMDTVIPTEIVSLINLEQFFIISCGSFYGGIPSGLASLTKLTGITISRSQKIKGTIPASLGQLINLKSIYLETIGLVGTIPTELGKLNKLESLNLNYNDLDGTIPTQIGKLINLKDMQLYDNKLIGSLPSSICAVTTLTYLAISEQKGGHVCVPKCQSKALVAGDSVYLCVSPESKPTVSPTVVGGKKGKQAPPVVAKKGKDPSTKKNGKGKEGKIFAA